MKNLIQIIFSHQNEIRVGQHSIAQAANILNEVKEELLQKPSGELNPRIRPCITKQENAAKPLRNAIFEVIRFEITIDPNQFIGSQKSKERCPKVQLCAGEYKTQKINDLNR